MKLAKQVNSLELGKKLKDLGVKQESLFYYCPTMISDGEKFHPNDDFELHYFTHPISNGYSAYTVAELGEMLKGYHLPEWSPRDKWHNGQQNEMNCTANTEANARAKMLIHLIEQGIIKEVGVDTKQPDYFCKEPDCKGHGES